MSSINPTFDGVCNILDQYKANKTWKEEHWIRGHIIEKSTVKLPRFLAQFFTEKELDLKQAQNIIMKEFRTDLDLMRSAVTVEEQEEIKKKFDKCAAAFQKLRDIIDGELGEEEKTAFLDSLIKAEKAVIEEQIKIFTDLEITDPGIEKEFSFDTATIKQLKDSVQGLEGSDHTQSLNIIWDSVKMLNQQFLEQSLAINLKEREIKALQKEIQQIQDEDVKTEYLSQVNQIPKIYVSSEQKELTIEEKQKNVVAKIKEIKAALTIENAKQESHKTFASLMESVQGAIIAESQEELKGKIEECTRNFNELSSCLALIKPKEREAFIDTVLDSGKKIFEDKKLVSKKAQDFLFDAASIAELEKNMKSCMLSSSSDSPDKLLDSIEKLHRQFLAINLERKEITALKKEINTIQDEVMRKKYILEADKIPEIYYAFSERKKTIGESEAVSIPEQRHISPTNVIPWRRAPRSIRSRDKKNVKESQTVQSTKEKKSIEESQKEITTGIKKIQEEVQVVQAVEQALVKEEITTIQKDFLFKEFVKISLKNSPESVESFNAKLDATKKVHAAVQEKRKEVAAILENNTTLSEKEKRAFTKKMQVLQYTDSSVAAENTLSTLLSSITLSIEKKQVLDATNALGNQSIRKEAATIQVEQLETGFQKIKEIKNTLKTAYQQQIQGYIVQEELPKINGTWQIVKNGEEHIFQYCQDGAIIQEKIEIHSYGYLILGKQHENVQKLLSSYSLDPDNFPPRRVSLQRLEEAVQDGKYVFEPISIDIQGRFVGISRGTQYAFIAGDKNSFVLHTAQVTGMLGMRSVSSTSQQVSIDPFGKVTIDGKSDKDIGEILKVLQESKSLHELEEGSFKNYAAFKAQAKRVFIANEELEGVQRDIRKACNLTPNDPLPNGFCYFYEDENEIFISYVAKGVPQKEKIHIQSDGKLQVRIQGALKQCTIEELLKEVEAVPTDAFSDLQTISDSIEGLEVFKESEEAAEKEFEEYMIELPERAVRKWLLVKAKDTKNQETYKFIYMDRDKKMKSSLIQRKELFKHAQELLKCNEENFEEVFKSLTTDKSIQNSLVSIQDEYKAVQKVRKAITSQYKASLDETSQSVMAYLDKDVKLYEAEMDNPYFLYTKSKDHRLFVKRLNDTLSIDMAKNPGRITITREGQNQEVLAENVGIESLKEYLGDSVPNCRKKLEGKYPVITETEYQERKGAVSGNGIWSIHKAERNFYVEYYKEYQPQKIEFISTQKGYTTIDATYANLDALLTAYGLQKDNFFGKQESIQKIEDFFYESPLDSDVQDPKSRLGTVPANGKEYTLVQGEADNFTIYKVKKTAGSLTRREQSTFREMHITVDPIGKILLTTDGHTTETTFEKIGKELSNGENFLEFEKDYAPSQRAIEDTAKKWDVLFDGDQTELDDFQFAIRRLYGTKFEGDSLGLPDGFCCLYREKGQLHISYVTQGKLLEEKIEVQADRTIRIRDEQDEMIITTMEALLDTIKPLQVGALRKMQERFEDIESMPGYRENFDEAEEELKEYRDTLPQYVEGKWLLTRDWVGDNKEYVFLVMHNNEIVQVPLDRKKLLLSIEQLIDPSGLEKSLLESVRDEGVSPEAGNNLESLKSTYLLIEDVYNQINTRKENDTILEKYAVETQSKIKKVQEYQEMYPDAINRPYVLYKDSSRGPHEIFVQLPDDLLVIDIGEVPGKISIYRDSMGKRELIRKNQEPSILDTYLSDAVTTYEYDNQIKSWEKATKTLFDPLVHASGTAEERIAAIRKLNNQDTVLWSVQFEEKNNNDRYSRFNEEYLDAGTWMTTISKDSSLDEIRDLSHEKIEEKLSKIASEHLTRVRVLEGHSPLLVNPSDYKKSVDELTEYLEGFYSLDPLSESQFQEIEAIVSRANKALEEITERIKTQLASPLSYTISIQSLYQNNTIEDTYDIALDHTGENIIIDGRLFPQDQMESVIAHLVYNDSLEGEIDTSLTSEVLSYGKATETIREIERMEAILHEASSLDRNDRIAEAALQRAYFTVLPGFEKQWGQCYYGIQEVGSEADPVYRLLFQDKENPEDITDCLIDTTTSPGFFEVHMSDDEVYRGDSIESLMQSMDSGLRDIKPWLEQEESIGRGVLLLKSSSEEDEQKNKLLQGLLYLYNDWGPYISDQFSSWTNQIPEGVKQWIPQKIKDYGKWMLDAVVARKQEFDIQQRAQGFEVRLAEKAQLTGNTLEEKLTKLCTIIESGEQQKKLAGLTDGEKNFYIAYVHLMKYEHLYDSVTKKLIATALLKKLMGNETPSEEELKNWFGRQNKELIQIQQKARAVDNSEGRDRATTMSTFILSLKKCILEE